MDAGRINRLGKFFGSRGGVMRSGAGMLPGLNTSLTLGQNVMMGRHAGGAQVQCTNCLSVYPDVDELRRHIKRAADGLETCESAPAGRLVE